MRSSIPTILQVVNLRNKSFLKPNKLLCSVSVMLTFRLTWGRPLSSSKGASEKRRLLQYVTNTVLDDNFKGTTEQFVLHFNEQFRQLDEISEDSEKLPPTVKLTLLQTAVRSINDLRIFETLDEFQSTSYGHGSTISLSYQTYYDLLINACVRYDKTKKANIGKRRNVYNTNIDDTYVDHPTVCIDHVPNSPYGGIDLPLDECYQVHTLSSRHPPSPRPGNPSRPSFRPQSQNSGPNKPIRRYDGPIFLPPQIYKLLSQDAMKALKAYNTEAINRFHQRKVHSTELWKHPKLTLLCLQYLKMTSLTFLKVT